MKIMIKAGVLAMLLGMAVAHAADFKVGVVDTERVLRESAPALMAESKIEKEFSGRDQEIKKLMKQAKELQALLEKEDSKFSDADRRNKERELTSMNADLQRMQREFREDLNQRRNEELAAVLERANRTIKAIAEAVDMPHILYNVPGRTVADMSNDTVLRLAQIPNIVGIKDATGNIERGSDLLQRAALLKRTHGDFAIYSGDDASTLALMLLGAHGTISVTANVAPKLMHEMCAAALNGEVAKAREINFRLLGLHRNLFVEANPIPVKWAVARMGKMKSTLRLPLTPLSPSAYPVVEAAMRQAGVL